MAIKSSGRIVGLLYQQLPHRPASTTSQRQMRKLHGQSRAPVSEDMLATVYNIPTLEDLQKVEGDEPEFHSDHLQNQLDLHSPVDMLREVLLQNMTPASRHDAIRFSVRQELSLPTSSTAAAPTVLPSFPLNGEPLPHSEFRDAINSRPGAKGMRRIIREQLLRCQLPRDILRVMAVAMQRRDTGREMCRMHESLRRALYRTRNNVSDEEVLKTINVLVTRFDMANLPVPDELTKLGIRFAARARSLPGMKRYLKEFKRSGGEMTRPIFRSTIAKFSIGTRGLGEIRNGRWRRKELLQVLLGFEDTPPEDAHHLGSFLERDDWQFYHAWLAVLARCKAVDELWKEWKYWLQSSTRTNHRKLNIDNTTLTTKTRGDHWFVEQMAYAGDLEKAWEILRVSEIPFANVRAPVRARLLDGAQYAPVPDEQISRQLLNKYAVELTRIERALGVEWVSGKDGHGYHVPQAGMVDSLEALSDPNFVFDPEHGFPWEEATTRERDEERNIMEAEEEEDVILP
ncbi:hypothetical protein BDV97DRAFT_373574 [Delphinella strobiligena]|nr:hypothetical protein BDV97DRAFT_373574 [Delphinella strobiligena]